MKVEDKGQEGQENEPEKNNPDQSNLDRKYFVDTEVYNCPFCNRRNVKYEVKGVRKFDWGNEKECFVHFVMCSSCKKVSMHLAYKQLAFQHPYGSDISFTDRFDLDSEIFYSMPTSFFIIDSRIPAEIRELIAESEGCLKMNYLTGASACARKAIYELTAGEKAEGEGYEEKIKSLKKKYPDSAPELFDILAHIQGMTSDIIHEQSWPKWDSANLKLMLETLKAVLHEIYVLPDEKKQRALAIKKLQEKLKKEKSS